MAVDQAFHLDIGAALSDAQGKGRMSMHVKVQHIIWVELRIAKEEG